MKFPSERRPSRAAPTARAPKNPRRGRRWKTAWNRRLGFHLRIRPDRWADQKSGLILGGGGLAGGGRHKAGLSDESPRRDSGGDGERHRGLPLSGRVAAAARLLSDL